MCFFDIFVILIWIYNIMLTVYTIELGKWIDYLLDRIEDLEKKRR